MIGWFERLRQLEGIYGTKDIREVIMKKSRWLTGAALLLLMALLMGTVSATGIGTENDPLVSLSYLQETFLPQILSGVDAMLEERDTQLIEHVDEAVAGVQESWPDSESGTTNRTFAVVTLSKGQKLMGEIGCEVMLRVGTAVCRAPSKPGLIDQTEGAAINDGDELVKNHLYMMTIEDRGVEATAKTVKVLVRGTYTIQ